MHPLSVLVIMTTCFITAQCRRLPRQVLFGQCYQFTTPASLNITKWTEGKWYEIQRFYNEFERKADCAAQVYFLDESKMEVDITFTVQNQNTTKLLQGKANYTVYDAEVDFEVKYPHDTISSSFDIVATQPDKYAVVYSCLQTSNDEFLPEKQERLWVLSRTPTLDASAASLIKAALVINGTDISRYLDQVSQDDCP